MKKLFLLLILSFFSTQSFAGSCPDGSEPVKSVSADGTYFVYNCGGGNEQSSSSNKTSKVDSAKSGISIENDPNIDFFKPPPKPYPTEQLYLWWEKWQIIDFNNDGLADVIYTGAMNLRNSTNLKCTFQSCSDQLIDDANKPQPALYLADADGKLHYSPELLIDNRDNKGMSLGGQLLIADYNNDKVPDIYIADQKMEYVGHGYEGYRDSYYLSQPNGTWLESSNTHLSHDNFKVWDHGAATGDIDNDGDMDVVITTMNAGFWCLMNDGSGFLTKRQCGGSYAFGLEIADMDNDGDLDAIVAGDEYSLYSNMLTGIHWNDGRGNFMPYNTTPLKQYKDTWGTISEVSASDLDNDGDMDIVYSRQDKPKRGAAIQIIENLGNKKFKDHGIIPLVEGFQQKYIFLSAILFRDLDKDGDIDLYLSSGRPIIDGAVVINNSNFDFSLIMPPESYELYERVTELDVIMPKKVLTKEEQAAKDEEQAVAAELAEFEAELEAELKAEEELIEKELAELEAELLEENKSSPLFDGRYSFIVLRYLEDEGNRPIGNGFLEIKDGNFLIEKKNRYLESGPTDLYDTLSAQIDKSGQVYGSITLDVLNGIDQSEVYEFNGSIKDKKIGGKGPYEDGFEVYFELK